MFVRSSSTESAVCRVLFVFTMGACGNFGGCGACGSTQPLPGGKLPTDQTVEGGAQIRVTPQGFTQAHVDPAGRCSTQQLGGGFCVRQGSVGRPTARSAPAPSGATTNSAAVHARLQGRTSRSTQTASDAGHEPAHAASAACRRRSTRRCRFAVKVLGIGVVVHAAASSSNNLNGDLDIAFGIKPANGELDIHLAQINQLPPQPRTSAAAACSRDIANLVDATRSTRSSVSSSSSCSRRVINNLIQGFLPNPLGIAGMMDVGKLLEGVSPGTEGFMEARIVPGGYVELDRQRHEPRRDHRPQRRRGSGARARPISTASRACCVPPIPAPNFARAAGEPADARSRGSTFPLAPAGAVLRQPGAGRAISRWASRRPRSISPVTTW